MEIGEWRLEILLCRRPKSGDSDAESPVACITGSWLRLRLELQGIFERNTSRQES